MPNISGKYNFKTRVGNTPECVFLYKKLQDTTRAFNYQTDIKTYQLSHIVGGVNDGRPHWAVIELPDNTGDYDSVSDAKNRKRTAKKKDAPCVAPDAGDDGSSAEDRRIVTVLWTIRHRDYIPPTGLIGKLAGWCGATSGHPYYTEAELMALNPTPLTKATYAFFNKYFSAAQVAFEGYKPYLPVDKAVFCHDIPANVGGQVSYMLDVQWNKLGFKPERISASDGLFYGEGLNMNTDLPSPYENWADFFEGYDATPVTARLTAIHQPVSGNELFATNDCGSDSLDAWWLYDYSSGDKQTVQIRGINAINEYDADREFICWRGRIADYGAWEGYMNTMLEFWGVLDNDRAELTRVVSMADNVSGGSCAEGGGGGGGIGPFPPDPTPPITPLIGTATFHGRYCDIFVNYQKNGIVRELKLPIDFPTRVTHVSYEHNNFYNINYPRESPGQRFEDPYFAEWFSGRVNIDKNNIYVDIIYGIYREYEDGKKIFPNGVTKTESGSYNTYPDRPGIINRWNEFTSGRDPNEASGVVGAGDSTEDDQVCIVSQNTEQVFARPTRDKFNKTVRYTIDKASFSIVNTQTFIQNHQETGNLFTDNFLKKNTILDISGLAGYRRYHSNGSMPNSEPPNPVVLNPSVNHQGFVGLPKPYFQVSCRPNNVEVTNQWIERPFESNPLLSDYSCYVANDFLTLKTDWDDIYWLFYLMMEQPYIDRTKPITPIQFKQRCQLKGAGYRANTNKYYLSFGESREIGRASCRERV